MPLRDPAPRGRTGRRWLAALSLLVGAACQPETRNATLVEATAVWGSPDGCTAALRAGERLPREEGTLRLATWNLRWFPRGCPTDRECPAQATDVAWMACGIAWMQVDVLAVQEVLLSEQGARGLEELTRALEADSGGRWRSDVQACGEEGGQAVGFVWDASRVTLEGLADVWELNGDRRAGPGDACAARLRPGRYARLVGRGGLDASLLSLHLDSGLRELDWERRRRALARLGEARTAGRRILDGDDDVVALGDFNSMGRSDAPAVEQDEEIAGLEAELGGAFRLATPDRACSGYYPSAPGRHASTLIDHLMPSVAMQEAGATARVSGFCASIDCPATIRGAMPAAFERLSDHCPVLLDVEDRDLDTPSGAGPRGGG